MPPKGSRNKERSLDPHRESIKAYLQTGLSIRAVMNLVNQHLEKPLTYNSYRYFIKTDDELRALREMK